MPKVSILIPCYNVEKYLEKCLESVISQTLKDIEIICIDDGSKDDTGKLLDAYAQKDNRIKVIHKENGGYGKAMNVGLANVTGEYVGIVEPDDYIELNMFESLYNKAKETDVDFVKSDFYMFEESMVQVYKKLCNNESNYNRVLNAKDDNFFNIEMNTWTGLYKTVFIRKNNIRYNETPGARYQDQGFWFQTIMFATTIYILNQAFYHYRYFQTNSSNNPNGYMWISTEYEYIARKLEENPDLKSKYEAYYQYFKFCYYLFNFQKLPKDEKKLQLKHFQQEFINGANIEKGLYSEWEYDLLQLLIKHPKKFYRRITGENSLLENLFSCRNVGVHKIIMILGIKFKFKNKYKELKSEIARLTGQNEHNLNKLENLKMNIDCNSSQLDRFRVEYAGKFQEMLTQILLEDNVKSYADINLQSSIDKFKFVAVSYWDNDTNGARFFNNFSFLFDNDSNINIINSYEKQNVYADVYFCWGTRPYLGQLINIYNSKLYKKNIYIVEDGFLRSIITNACAKELTKYHKGISFTFDCKSVYYDARHASTLELMLNNSSLIITEEQKQRARACIDRIVETHLSKYNHQPIYEPHIGREGVKKVLVVDQSYGDMSIAKGLADNTTFEQMLECAIRENPDSDIIVKTHPDTIAGSRGYYTAIKQHDNIYTQTEPINPISLTKYVDKVYVCTTQLGFEALMCGKEVHVFGMPFYAGWGLTHDRQKCERRTNTRTLEEVFYIAYIMYSYYVNPEKKCRCEIEEAMDYLLKLRDEYFNTFKVINE